MENFIYDELLIGQSAEVTFDLTMEITKDFASISGDDNPIHHDVSYAAQTSFKKPIGHGLLVASLFSRLLGTKLPGPGTIYISQTLNFLYPAYVGDTIIAKVTIKEKLPKNRVLITCECSNQSGITLLNGDAMVLAPITK